MPAVDVDDDTLQAVRNCWQGDSANLPALFTEPPKTGRLKSPQTFPYAYIASEAMGQNQRMTGGVRHDFRKVTIKVWGIKQQTTACLAAVLARFNLQLGADGKPTLVMPSGAIFRQWWPLDDGKLEEEPDRKAGKDLWIGIVTAKVWTIRTD